MNKTALVSEQKTVSADVWSDEQAEWYLQGIEGSDYADKVGAALKELIGTQHDLLDIGAGEGTLSRCILAEGARWTAIEPNLFLADFLAEKNKEWSYQLTVLPECWQTSQLTEPHVVSLAANMSGPIYETTTFWSWQRQRSQKTMIWIVPAQDGPNGHCLSGFLPEKLHGETITNRLKHVLDELGHSKHPDQIQKINWSFRQHFADYQQAEKFFHARFNPTNDGERANALRVHLEKYLEHDKHHYFATAKKCSAVLIWQFN